MKSIKRSKTKEERSTLLYPVTRKKKRPTKKKKIKAYSTGLKRKLFKTLPYLGLILFLLLIILIGYFMFYHRDFINISNVEVSGTSGFVEKNDLKELVKESSYGNSILLFNTEDLKKTLLLNFQGAKDISIEKKLPRTLIISVVERVPMALISNDGTELAFMVDEGGYVLGVVKKDTINLPKINYNGDIRVGYFLDKNLIPVYLGLLTTLDNEKISVNSINASNKDIKLALASGEKVHVSISKDIKDSITLLSRLLKQLELEGKKARIIDLRYDKVVVSYE